MSAPRTSESDPIRVAIVEEPRPWPGSLGVTFAPGKRCGSMLGPPWARDLAADLARLRETYGADWLITLLEDRELAEFEIADLGERAEALGMRWLHLPIVDKQTPTDLSATLVTVAGMRGALDEGQTVVVHCRGGLGRAGTIASCCLATAGVAPEAAIEAVRRVRPGAVENAAQEQFVAEFAETWAACMADAPQPAAPPATAPASDVADERGGSWFERLVGFAEESRDAVLAQLSLEDGRVLVSAANGRRFDCGELTLPSLAELRQQAAHLPAGRPAVREVIADVQALHVENPGGVFQVASQFNLLEMVGPDVTPDAGVTIYERDRTQGPACAIACGAGTIYRNYLAPAGDQPGQTADRQLDALADLGAALGNEGDALWQMRNGYALASEAGLAAIAERLAAASPAERDALRATLRVGVQRDVGVTLPGGGHRVTQVYASALPVAYSQHGKAAWEPFARLVLEAAYEATLLVAALEADRHGGGPLFLTLLGGGAFGNDPDWIEQAIERALAECGHFVDVAVVSYGQSNPRVKAMAARW